MLFLEQGNYSLTSLLNTYSSLDKVVFSCCQAWLSPYLKILKGQLSVLAIMGLIYQGFLNNLIPNPD